MWAHLLLEGLKTTRPYVTQKLTQSTQNVTATLTSAQGDPHPPATPVRAMAVRLSACWGPQRCGSNPAHFPEWHREGPCRTAAPVGHLVELTGGRVCAAETPATPTSASRGRHTHTRRPPTQPLLRHQETRGDPFPHPARKLHQIIPETLWPQRCGCCCRRLGSLKRKQVSHPETSLPGTSCQASSSRGSRAFVCFPVITQVPYIVPRLHWAQY